MIDDTLCHLDINAVCAQVALFWLTITGFILLLSIKILCLRYIKHTPLWSLYGCIS